jgi:formate hydrogenlyase subunit 4
VISWLEALLHLVIALSFPPLLLGIIGKVKGFAGGRVGPPVLQPYRDLLRLFRKGFVYSRTTTWVFRAGPVIGLATVLLALALMPLGSHRAPLGFGGDVLVFAGLLALGRFFTVAAALDTGSSFEGMGAAREATFSALAEPGLFLGLMVLVRHATGASLNLMLSVEGTTRAWATTPGALVMVAVSFFVVLLVENSRIPVDDPATHLELTMIHEVMVLDHSGPALGLIHYGAALKLFVFAALVVNVALPVTTGDVLADWALFLGGMVALAVGVAVLESTMARLRLLHVPRLLVASSILSVFGIILGS